MTNIDLNSFTVEEKIGQLFVFGFDGLEVNDHAIELIKDHKVGNVILFARNVKTAEQLFNLNQNLQRLAYDNIGIPLFITIDQEGGMVTRIHNGGTFFPGAMTIGATNDVENAYKAGLYMGRELKAFGINMDLAPVLDVNNNPKNPVIGVRSFSDDSQKVADFGISFAKGLEQSVLATVKHFPGHGDTHLDSHLALPKVDYPLERLNRVELVPFKHAINEGVQAIMSSHIDFPALTEDGLPTTLSKKCMTDYVRGTLGYEGLLVTDGMQMKAIQDNYGTVEASLMAIEAGMNLVCICHAKDLQIQATKHVKQAIESGRLSLETLNERFSRVLRSKHAMAQPDLEQTFKDIEPIVNNETHRRFAYDVVRQGATRVKGKTLELSDNALFVGVNPKATSVADETHGDQTAMAQIKEALPHLTVEDVPLTPDATTIEMIIKLAKTKDQIIIQTYNANIYDAQISLIEALHDLDKEVYVIAMRNPYDLLYTDVIQNYICLYEYTPHAIKVLIEVLKGTCPLQGTLPVNA